MEKSEDILFKENAVGHVTLVVITGAIKQVPSL